MAFVGKQSWLRCWCVERRRKTAVFKTVFLVGKVRQSSCFCAHGCSVLTAVGVLAWKERGKERKAGVCRSYGVKVQQKARRRSGFACTGVGKLTASGKSSFFGGFCSQSRAAVDGLKEGTVARQGVGKVRSKLVKGFDWRRQSNLGLIVLSSTCPVPSSLLRLTLRSVYLKTTKRGHGGEKQVGE
ncbi:MAG: hypothetical protein GY820_08365 [Gammaproteobacteria bacterium]|nr:hypothetical protein [Gammaproteobacteria bacterium]